MSRRWSRIAAPVVSQGSSTASIEDGAHIGGSYGHLVVVGEVEAMDDLACDRFEEVCAPRTTGSQGACDLSKSNGERRRRPLHEEPGGATSDRKIRAIVVTASNRRDRRGQRGSVSSDERSQDVEESASIHLLEA